MNPEPHPKSPFRPGALVIATLSNPREKFWGAILHLSPTGLSLRGVDLSSFDDFISQIRDGEPFAAGVMFFPMHRLERLDLDLPESTIPSLSQRFAEKTGQDPAPLLISEFLPTAADEATEVAVLHAVANAEKHGEDADAPETNADPAGDPSR